LPFHHFRNSPRDLELIELPIKLPIYRIANFRTRKHQLAYVHKNGKPIDYFESGQEDVVVQKIQHEFLYEYAQKGSGESIIAITRVLESEPQTEPLLITVDGVVVNGNRRLSAMREFYGTGQPEYSHFSHVQCLVLPEDATPEDIRLIELRLQAVPQTLLPYEWVNDALLIRDMMTDLKSEDRVAKEMKGLRKASELRLRVLALELGEQYLAWRGTPDDFDELIPREQLFGDMAKYLKDKVGDELEASRLIGFVLGEHRSDFGTRLYEYNMAFSTKTEEVIQSASKMLNIDLSPPKPLPDDEDLEIFLPQPSGDGVVSYKPFITELRNLNKSVQIKDAIKTACDDIRERDAGVAQGLLALRAAQGAARMLAGIDLTKAEPATYAELEAQFAVIRGRVQVLERELAPKKLAKQ